MHLQYLVVSWETALEMEFKMDAEILIGQVDPGLQYLMLTHPYVINEGNKIEFSPHLFVWFACAFNYEK